MEPRERSGDGSWDGAAPPPVVSVVIPTWNRLPYLKEAVESVRAQTLGDWELLVVDDGSTDGTAAWVRGLGDPRVRLVEAGRTANLPRLRNIGIREARARWVAFLDSDDRWLPSKLERQLQALWASPEHRWSYTRACVMDANGTVVEDSWLAPAEPLSGWILERLLVHDVRIVPSSVMVERDFVLGEGGFDETFLVSEDYELWTRLAGVAPLLALPDHLCHKRRHGGSMSFGQPEIEEALVRIYALRAAAAGSPRIRRLCRAQEGVFRLRWANQLAARGRIREGIRVLLKVFPRRGATLAWWATLAKALARPFTPDAVRRRFRRPQPWRA